MKTVIALLKTRRAVGVYITLAAIWVCLPLIVAGSELLPFIWALPLIITALLVFVPSAVFGLYLATNGFGEVIDKKEAK